MKPALSVIFLLAALSVGASSQSRTLKNAHGPPIAIPQIAKLAGMKVGWDEVEKLEQRLGTALRVTGGHPGGRRLWRSRQTGWYIDADGFDHKRHSDFRYNCVIEQFYLSVKTLWPEKRDEIPFVSMPRQKLRWMDRVELGMTKTKVLHIVKRMIPPPTIKGDTFTWEAKGFVRINSQDIYTRWTAELTFEKGRLVCFALDCG